jgi:hypothetical protein
MLTLDGLALLAQISTWALNILILEFQKNDMSQAFNRLAAVLHSKKIAL